MEAFAERGMYSAEEAAAGVPEEKEDMKLKGIAGDKIRRSKICQVARASHKPSLQ